MTDRLAQNKRTVMAFYDLMFNQCSPAEAVQKYVGEDYIQHNPAVGDGKEALIAYFERMLKEFPGKGLSSSGSLRRKTMSCFTATSSSPETAIRQGSRSRLDDHGKIVEHWDRLQVFSATAANNNLRLISLFHQPLPLADNEIERRDDMAKHAHRTAKETGVVPDQHNEEEEIYFRAQAFHKAAKVLVKAFGGGTAPRMESETLPIISMYRQAVELHLKAIVLGYGGNFLPVRPVLARIRGTHSLQALVVLACQILEGVGWEQGFKTEAVADLCDLRAVTEKLEALDTSLRAFRPGGDKKRIVIGSLAATITEFAKQVDAVLDILDAAADALAAMADTGVQDGESEFNGGGTVQ